jgi:hypothetical protein
MATTELAIHLTENDMANGLAEAGLEFYDATEERKAFYVFTITTANSKVKWFCPNDDLVCDIYQSLGHLIAKPREQLRKKAQAQDDKLTEVIDRGRG